DSGVLFGGNQPNRNETAPFIRDYIIDKARIQPVQTKLDSVLIKGSKILQRHPKSNFIEGSLFLMAKSYYYKNDWMNAEIKCSELVDLFPFGDLSPDAHLLMAQAYFIERKYILGEQALSRCIDIAWYKDRYDILAEAFKFSAEHYIYFNEVDKAVRPYKQAIAITESGAQASKWHLELGSIYYRLSRWEEAEKEFHQVGDFDVDLLGEYEARLFRASSLIYMKKYQEAEEILDAMSSNENYKDWEGSLLAEKMRLYRLSGKDSLFIDSEKKADTYSGNPNIAAMYFEKGMEYFRKNDYVKSRIYFAKSRGAKSPVARAANEYYTLLNEMETNKIEIHKTNQLVKKNVPITDTVKTLTAARYFAVGRV
ncbi:MAG TPA: tetratricopeptide repeat protein, partial [Candidatus Kapabacteria bacterium]|nr:tetratricopeptide repeat protein [Candidatus Kapabacteria bacterium]